MTFRIADSFSDSLARLTTQEQKAAKTAAFDLQMSPDNPGLSLHRVDRARDKGFWTARVNRDIRLVLHKTGGDTLLAWVGHHDDAYAWAERRRLESHPRTGAMQIVEIRETVEEVVIQRYVEEAVRKPQRPDTDGVVEAQLAASAEEQARLPLTLAGPNGAPPLTWVLDLPRPRGEFQNVEGETLAENRDISMQTLKDWRIVPAEGQRTDLRIRLHSPSAGGAPVVGKRLTVDQPLTAFRPLLEEMLVTGGADAELRLRVVTGADQSPRLRVRHALGETQLVGEGVSVLQDQTPLHEPALEVTAVDLDDPSRVVKTGARGLSHLGNGRWFLLPRRGGVPMRPPRPFVRPEPVESTGQDAPRRADRVAHYACRFHGADVAEDLSRLATLSETLLANGVSPSALDEVHALAQVPSAAVRLLFRVAPSDLEDALSLDLHGGPRWAFISPGEWSQGFADEAEVLRGRLAALPALADKADEQARDAITARAADILRLRPALQGHVALALQEVDPMAIGTLAQRLGGLSRGLQKPEATLLENARAIVSRQASNPPSLHELAARRRPSGFDAFHPDLRGLVDAPIIVAEIAFGLRPPPTTRERVELLLAVQADQAGYEAAQPAAIAWLAQQGT